MKVINLSGKNKNAYIRLSMREKGLLLVKGILAMIILDYFFYRSFMALIPLSVIGVCYIKQAGKEMMENRKNRVREEFRELLLLSSTGLRAGYSIENAMLKSAPDLRTLYGDDSVILKLLKEIGNVRRNNGSLSEVFKKAGNQMQIEEITEFGFVYEHAYQKSGNMSTVMDRTSSEIIRKTELEEAIRQSLNERRFEMKIMNLMPFLIMFYIGITSRGYFDGMYHNPVGILIMSAAMGIYLFAYVWGLKIAEIRV